MDLHPPQEIPAVAPEPRVTPFFLRYPWLLIEVGVVLVVGLLYFSFGLLNKNNQNQLTPPFPTIQSAKPSTIFSVSPTEAKPTSASSGAILIRHAPPDRPE